MKKVQTFQFPKDELQKQLEWKNAALKRLIKKTKISEELRAKEAQVELGLEIVRERAMAMHNSNDVGSATAVMFTELEKLGIVTIRCGILIVDESRIFEVWAATTSKEGKVIRIVGKLDSNIHPLLQGAYSSWLRKEPSFIYELKGKDLQDYYRAISSAPEYNIPALEARLVRQSCNISFFKEGGLFAYTLRPLSRSAMHILKKFATVFGLTYRRFLDLQKAEAQVREAQIQVSLERVRSGAMSMYKPADLTDICEILFKEFQTLGFSEIRNAMINIHNDDEKTFVNYDYSDEIGKSSTPLFYNIHPLIEKQIKEIRSANDAFSETVFKGKDLKEWKKFRKERGEKDDPRTNNIPGLYYYFYSIGAGSIGISTFGAIGEEKLELLKRFRNVFNLAYQRYADLALAEASAREAQIQLALERVRARTMAMQHSDELKHAAALLFQQVIALGAPAYSCGYNLWEKDEKEFTSWMSTQDGSVINGVSNIPLTEDANFIRYVDSKQNGEPFFVLELRGQRMQEHYKYLKTIPAFKAYFDYAVSVGFDLPDTQIHHLANFSHGNLLFITLEPCLEFHDVFKRFAAVFEQTYTRFLDLQKAEAQAREAQIEASLERVRSKTMAMHNSEDVGDTVATMFDEFVKLGIQTNRCGILIFSNEPVAEVWTAKSNPAGRVNLIIGKLDMTVHRLLHGIHKAWKNKEPFYHYTMEGDDLRNYYQALNVLEYYPTKFDMETLPSKEFHSDFYFPEGSVFAFTASPVPDETSRIIKKFAAVFGQTYRRYLDLKKAEAQAREAEIELSLERIRSKAMAMHSSGDILATTTTAFEELQKLGIHSIRCGIGLLSENSMEAQVYASAKGSNGLFQTLVGARNMNSHPSLTRQYQAWLKQENLVETIHGKELETYYNSVFFQSSATSAIPQSFEKKQYGYYFSFADGLFYSWTNEPYTENELNILNRFKAIVGLTFRRFLDLQKAEAQVRQAKIEAAMEKVRSRAMGMQKPDELIDVAEVLRKEMGLLGVEELETSSIYIHHENTQQTECWYAIKDREHADKELVSDHMTINLTETSVGKEMLEFYRSGKKQISISMQGDARKEWINYCAAHSKVLVGFYGDHIPDRTYHLYKFSNGYMGAASPGDISAESWELLQRATSVFSLAYTRFSDLQQAEAQVREARVEAALERVRSRTLAMQKSDELAETSAVLFKQLITLGIEPNRLYISIMKDDDGESEFWITDEEGRKVSAAYTDNLNSNASFKKMFDAWKAGKPSMIIDMKGKELKEYFNHLTSLGVPFKDGLKQKRRITYLAFFNRGFIGMAAPDDQPKETIHLLERFAAVFNLTFTRFNDLKVAEAHAMQAEQDLVEIKNARKKAEETLSELQVTQNQLIQKEKMASLGELTAGIAHEIQNPLNFVNNFSDVNKELVDELQIELKSGNTEEAIAISNNIKDNEEKINHHGKRADAIVKGMLQHSRKTEGVKEPADINALANEYLRLAYHGLRAKDKSFNAELVTRFDKKLPKVNVIPQDIVRVLLNLFNNAFYAVNQKQKTADADFKPGVTVTTTTANSQVVIKVKDNGIGIPDAIKEKIMQPFFTTKPTGEGTGLGLSLTYDMVVKGHGGKIEVNTKDGEFTEFMVSLPLNET